MSTATIFQGFNIPCPDVSVIIPTYNRLSMLEEALASVASQDFDGVVEIIVVDDNSQDGTSEIVSRKYPNVHLISLKQNVGAYAARNRALVQAKGKYIAFLDSDDLWETHYLRTQITALEGKERHFCISNIVIWDTAENQKQVWVQKPNLERYDSLIHHLLVKSFIYTPSSVVIPRQAFDELGLFDETIRVGEDAALYERCIVAGYQPIFTELPVAIKRKHGKDHLTNAKNLKIRKESRMVRVNKLYPLLEKRFDLVPLQSIYADMDADFASQYFNNGYFFHWLVLSLASARNASLQYALFNMIRDIKELLYKELVRRRNNGRREMNRQPIQKFL
ncbi:MAG: glycosyltransferase [Coleofasciculus sp. S288]|nr:glycosyltransferase [Coleofasciculus sp. S288]